MPFESLGTHLLPAHCPWLWTCKLPVGSLRWRPRKEPAMPWGGSEGSLIYSEVFFCWVGFHGVLLRFIAFSLWLMVFLVVFPCVWWLFQKGLPREKLSRENLSQIQRPFADFFAIKTGSPTLWLDHFSKKDPGKSTKPFAKRPKRTYSPSITSQQGGSRPLRSTRRAFRSRRCCSSQTSQILQTLRPPWLFWLLLASPL